MSRIDLGGFFIMDDNTMNENIKEILPRMAFEEIPTPKPDAQEIVELQKDSGEVTGYKLSGGEVLSVEEAIALARQGGIKDVGIATNKGTEYLKSLPDDDESNNLSHLPSFEGETEAEETE